MNLIQYLLFIFLLSCSLPLKNANSNSRIPSQVNDNCHQYQDRLKNTIMAKNFPILKMGEQFRGENINGATIGNSKVRYYSERDRQEFEVFVNCEGQVVDYEGNPLSSPALPIYTRGIAGLYVIDTSGRMYLTFNRITGVIHHSSLVAGADVLAAGEMILVDGKIDVINKHSGHYLPGDESLDLLIDALVSLGVKINDVE